jgi:SAM-dependent methyltransferase
MLLATLICCMDCGKPLDESAARDLRCACGATVLQRNDGLYLTPILSPLVEMERSVRDRQAANYLQHSKFPTQVNSFRTWLQQVLTRSAADRPLVSARPVALDLGCGPGPYTRYLQQAGFDVLAIDTSTASLAINAANCDQDRSMAEACFVQLDLNRLALRPESVDLVLMADFMQHLGGRQQRERLLRCVALAMKPDAHFYLSFFNLNIKNFLKGDVHGAFADGAIRYERLTVPNMLAELPSDLLVERTEPLNTFHAAAPDRLAARLPGVYWLARMAAISGRKSGEGQAP